MRMQNECFAQLPTRFLKKMPQISMLRGSICIQRSIHVRIPTMDIDHKIIPKPEINTSFVDLLFSIKQWSDE